MPEDNREPASDFPPFLGPGRRWMFLLLLLVALAEALAQVGTGRALTAVIDHGEIVLPSVFLLGAAFCVLGGLIWARSLAAEWIGQDYVNDVRSGLARQAVRSALGRGRLGTISTRMSADLAALKNWSDAGICGGVTGIMTLLAGWASAFLLAGPEGFLSSLIGPALSLALVALLWQPLAARIRLRRAARGLLSARTGDAVFAARTAAVFAAMRRFVGPIRKAGVRVARASVRTVSLAQVLKASAVLTLPAGVVGFLYLRSPAPTLTAAEWGGLIYALGLCSAGNGALMLAVEALLERRIAVRKLRDLDRQASEAPPLSPSGTIRLRPDTPRSLWVDGIELARPGNVSVANRTEWPGISGRLMRGEPNIFLGGVEASEADARDWARRVAIVSESIPIPRGRLADAVATRRKPSKRALRKALITAGFDPEQTGLDPVIDTQRQMVDPPQLARLRLVRALLCLPDVIVIDDPWLLGDACLRASLDHWAKECCRAVVWLVPGELQLPGSIPDAA